jgi:CRP/FNR family transcriptional regulator
MGKHAPHIDCQNCTARKASVFCELKGDHLQDLNQSKSCGIYKKSSVVFNEGQRPLGLFCVNEGKIKVYQTGSEGKEQIVRLAKEGDILGYRALLSGETYSCSAEAIDDSKVCFISKDSFFRILNSDGSLSFEMMKLLSQDLRKAEHRITDLAQKPVRERMAEALLFVKETYGFEDDGVTINAVLSREDLANIVGTATETAIRLLSDFRSEKLLAQRGKKIQILDLNRLVEISGALD